MPPIALCISLFESNLCPRIVPNCTRMLQVVHLLPVYMLVLRVLPANNLIKSKGVMGAGVCVVDGNLQIGASEYKTALIMNGGEISGNAGVSGGGIYSYSNGVELNAGKITNNTASNIGG